MGGYVAGVSARLQTLREMYRRRSPFQSLVDNLLCAIANALIGGAPLAGLVNLRNNLLRAL